MKVSKILTIFNTRHWLLSIIFLLPLPMMAATITWDGGGGDTFWDNPLNWDSNTVPTAADDVLISTGATVEVRLAGTVAKAIDVEDNAWLMVVKNATLLIDGADDSGDFGDGIQLMMNAGLLNRGSIVITGFDNEGINVDDAGAKVDNYGTITITGDGDDSSEGVELDEGAFFNNHKGAVLTISNTDNEVFCSEGTVVNDGIMNLTTSPANNDGLEIDNAPFTNNGTININVAAGLSDEPLDVDNLFRNNGIVNITGTGIGITEEAIIVRDDGKIDNGTCGIINIVDNEIEIEASGLITNSGIITTGFTGTNTNNGTFTNNYEIRTSDGAFLIAPNALQGGGTIKVGGATSRPSSKCNPIPTMSQWGLLIFGLLILNLGIVFIYRQQEAL